MQHTWTIQLFESSEAIEMRSQIIFDFFESSEETAEYFWFLYETATYAVIYVPKLWISCYVGVTCDLTWPLHSNLSFHQNSTSKQLTCIVRQPIQLHNWHPSPLHSFPLHSSPSDCQMQECGSHTCTVWIWTIWLVQVWPMPLHGLVTWQWPHKNCSWIF